MLLSTAQVVGIDCDYSAGETVFDIDNGVARVSIDANGGCDYVSSRGGGAETVSAVMKMTKMTVELSEVNSFCPPKSLESLGVKVQINNTSVI